jgi:hypothetical protein
MSKIPMLLTSSSFVLCSRKDWSLRVITANFYVLSDMIWTLDTYSLHVVALAHSLQTVLDKSDVRKLNNLLIL